MALATAAPLGAQLPLKLENTKLLSSTFDRSVEHEALDCHVEPMKPFFDFAFRFELGYTARCSLSQFRGEPADVGTVLKITPENGNPVSLGQHFTVPPIAAQYREKIQWQHLHAEIELSGVFAAGEGEYEIDLALVDGRNRIHRKSWRAKAFLHGKESQAVVEMKPNTVAAISLPFWKGTSTSATGFHLTVLLDAAPINPYSRKLRAGDGAFLRGAVSSLLRQLPVASVRLVAFNLDQQTRIFEDKDFDRTGLRKLAEALDKLELGRISYQTLHRQNGWAELLAKLVREETSAEHRADAVVFIGPTNRIDAKIEPEFLSDVRRTELPLFYFEYFPRLGRDFPDAIERVTSAQAGTTFKIHSPGELAAAITRMRKKLDVDARSKAMHTDASPGRKLSYPTVPSSMMQ